MSEDTRDWKLSDLNRLDSADFRDIVTNEIWMRVVYQDQDGAVFWRSRVREAGGFLARQGS